jgi:hypothetical protein
VQHHILAHQQWQHLRMVLVQILLIEPANRLPKPVPR